jgi:hypothetical protein
VETIAASYVQQHDATVVRLFNLSPDTKAAGMTNSGNGTEEIVTGVAYSLGSRWVPVVGGSSTFGIKDDSGKGGAKTIATLASTPKQAPIGNTAMLLGLQTTGGRESDRADELDGSGGGGGAYAAQVVMLDDAPEGGTCHP